MTTDPRNVLTVLSDAASKIACTLDAGDVKGRLDEWRSLAERATDRQSIEGGLRLTFDEIDVRALADLAIREHECCSFLSFTVGIGAKGTTLDILGPAAVRPLINALV
jgi:hypothetical protein